MTKWAATVLKEWQLLVRDWAGLLQLFAMPAVLVIVITLVQDSVLRQTAALQIYGVVVNRDGGRASQMLVDQLKASEVLHFIEMADGTGIDEAVARQWVEERKAQFYIVIPQGLTTALDDILQTRMDKWMGGQEMPPTSNLTQAALDLKFDPTVNKIYRATVSGDIARAMAKMQSILTMRRMGPALNQRVRQQLNAQFGTFAGQLPDQMIPPLEGVLPTTALIHTVEQSIGSDSYAQLPSAAQQNVPAWALFGMFFIVVPLSNILIVERREGILARLMTMPVSMAALILGKLAAYVMVCLVQFLCIAMVGRWLLPVLGTDPLILDRQQAAIVITAIISALAATGYGIMLGALSRTNQQANVVGPLSIVIAAALGGIMVPVFAMPPVMQRISHISPLAWAHDAFMVLMVRGGTLVDAWWQLTLLLLFFLTTFAVALLSLRRYH